MAWKMLECGDDMKLAVLLYHFFSKQRNAIFIC